VTGAASTSWPRARADATPAVAGARWLRDPDRVPPGMLRGGHRQTVLARLVPTAYPRRLPRPVDLDVDVAPGARVRVVLTLHAPHAPLLVLVHGLAGSAHSKYMLRTTAEAWSRGWSVARVNLRNAGGTHHLSRGLFNLLQWPDVGRVLERLVETLPSRRVAAVGFSLGGTLLLNLVAREPAPAALLAGLVAVNPPLDIPRSVARVCSPENRLYMRIFTRSMIHDVRVKRRLGEPYADPAGIASVPDYDRRFVLAETGCDTLDGYYAAASAFPHLGAVRVPAAILSAHDDPLIPTGMIADAAATAPHLAVRLVPHGGHVGYLVRRGTTFRFWAAAAALDFLETLAPAPRHDPVVLARRGPVRMRRA
jgi:predicted alpha/beta-fold hydrolase